MGHELKADLKMGAEALGVKLSVTAGQEEIPVGGETKEVDVLVSIANAEGKARTPADVVCVVDISGSMGSRAEVQNENGQSESHGLNLLDIVKHAVRTVFHALGPEDRLCVVAFDHCAEVSLKLTEMDAAGKALAEAAVEQLHPRGSTNLWAGLKEALEILSSRDGLERQRLGSILLLTDGCPNQRPPEGELAELQKYREAGRGQLPAVVNTFGFGYNLDSALLRDLAVEGDGSYAFIPDSGFVGTCFVHALGNLLVTAHRDAVLHLEPLNGAELRTKLVDGNIGARGATFAEYPASVDAAAGRTSLRLGTLQHGQARELVVRMAGILPEAPSEEAAAAGQAGAVQKQPYLSATLEFRPVLTSATTSSEEAAAVRVLATSRSSSAADPGDRLLRLAPAACRQATVEMLRELVKKRSGQQQAESDSTHVRSPQAMLESLILEVRSSPAAASEETKALLEDLEGQVTEALSRDDWYRKWGRHYLPSLARAHQLQICNNFKDPGVQGYGGKLFTELRDEADDLFVSLPPPKPSLPPARGSCGGYGGGNSSAPIVSMAAYHNACGG